MADTTIFPGDVDIQGNLRVRGTQLPSIPRGALIQEDFAVFGVNPATLRVWDAFGTNLPATSSADDLGLYNGAWLTLNPYVGTGDRKATTATAYARFLFNLPPSYVPGQSVRLRLNAGMKTTVSDGTATIDVEAYKCDRTGAVSGSDLCGTAAQSINSLVFANKDFDFSTSTLWPGDWIDVRIAIAMADGATGTAVIGAIGAIEMLLDIQG